MRKGLMLFFTACAIPAIVACTQPKSEKIEKQIEKAKTLDALLVLGGEKEDKSRSNYALDLYHQIKESRKNPLYIVLTGGQSGLIKEKREKAESEAMTEYLISKGIPKNVIFNETQSKDTLTNIIYAQPLLKEISAKKVGIVTDKYHMNGGIWAAKRVLGKDYETYALPNEKEGSFIDAVTELMVKYAQKIDLCVTGVKSGNQEAFEKYVKEKHPFYNKNAPLGAYKSAIWLYKKLNIK